MCSGFLDPGHGGSVALGMSDAGGGSRTRTALRPADFKSAASASSATPAGSAYVVPGCNESGGKRSGPRKRSSSRNVENASSSNSCTSRGTRCRSCRPDSKSSGTVQAPSAILLPSFGIRREQHPGRVLVVEVAQLLHGRRRHLGPVEDEDGAVLEVVHDLRDLERIRVFPVDRGRRDSAARSSADRCSTSGSRSRRAPRCGRRPAACTVFSWQPPASIVAARSLSPPPVRKTTPRTIASPIRPVAARM